MLSLQKMQQLHPAPSATETRRVELDIAGCCPRATTTTAAEKESTEFESVRSPIITKRIHSSSNNTINVLPGPAISLSAHSSIRNDTNIAGNHLVTSKDRQYLASADIINTKTVAPASATTIINDDGAPILPSDNDMVVPATCLSGRKAQGSIAAIQCCAKNKTIYSAEEGHWGTVSNNKSHRRRRKVFPQKENNSPSGVTISTIVKSSLKYHDNDPDGINKDVRIPERDMERNEDQRMETGDQGKSLTLTDDSPNANDNEITLLVRAVKLAYNGNPDEKAFYCHEDGAMFDEIEELRLHIRQKTAWSNRSLLGCRVAVMLEPERWYEGKVVAFNALREEHCVIYGDTEKHWCSMKSKVFYIVNHVDHIAESATGSISADQREEVTTATVSHLKGKGKRFNRIQDKDAANVRQSVRSTDQQQSEMSAENGTGGVELGPLEAAVYEETKEEEESSSHDTRHAREVSVSFALAQSLIHVAYGRAIQQIGYRTDAHLCVTKLERDDADATSTSLLYGEILPLGIDKALNKDHLRAASAKLLLDMGMGTGKLAMQAFLQFINIERVVGVEICRSRYNIGEEALHRLQSHYPAEFTVTACEKGNLCILSGRHGRRLEFYCADMFDMTKLHVWDADIIILQTNMHSQVYDLLCHTLARMKKNCRILSYLNLATLYPEGGIFPFQQLPVNRCISDRFCTTWSTNRGFHFFLWKKVICRRCHHQRMERNDVHSLVSHALLKEFRGRNNRGCSVCGQCDRSKTDAMKMRQDLLDGRREEGEYSGSGRHYFHDSSYGIRAEPSEGDNDGRNGRSNDSNCNYYDDGERSHMVPKTHITSKVRQKYGTRWRLSRWGLMSAKTRESLARHQVPINHSSHIRAHAPPEGVGKNEGCFPCIFRPFCR